jgi:GntR family transcriptional regulator, vanillate catabolism transcriptional regulator
MVERRRRGTESQTQTALLGIRELILSEALRPGDRVSELAMVERLGVSRTPVRAALARLELEGLLVALPSGGHEVRGFSQADVSDAIELRGALEGLAARLAAERGAAAARLFELDAIIASIDAVLAARPVDIPADIEINTGFHDKIMQFSGSAVVREQFARVTALPFAAPSSFVFAQSEAAHSLDLLIVAQSQHKWVAEAIAAREGARAEALMKEHARLARWNLDLVTRERSLRARVPGLQLVAADDAAGPSARPGEPRVPDTPTVRRKVDTPQGRKAE